jgi:hypothetical protein
MAGVIARWNKYWFAPTAPTNLAIGRMVFFGLLCSLYLPYDFSSWAEVDAVFWMPTWSFAVLRLPVLDADALRVLQAIWKVALACACIGLATRASIATVLVLGFYLLGLPHCFGKVHHYDSMLVFVFAILALARPGDAYSVDRLLVRRRDPRPIAPSGAYTWPVRAIWVVLACVFFGAGVSKLRASGLAWVASDNLAIVLVQAQYFFGNAVPLSAAGLPLAAAPVVYRVLAGAAVAGEVGYPLALVSGRARAVLVPGMLLMQLAIRVLLGPTFFPMMSCNVFWVPWDRILVAIVRAPR